MKKFFGALYTVWDIVWTLLAKVLWPAVVTESVRDVLGLALEYLWKFVWRAALVILTAITVASVVTLAVDKPISMAVTIPLIVLIGCIKLAKENIGIVKVRRRNR